MVWACIYLVISCIIFFLGVFQITRQNRNTLNWYFFALCVIEASIILNKAALFFTAFSEGVSFSESSYVYSNFNIISSASQLLVFPVLFGFIRNLSKNTFKGVYKLQLVLNIINTLSFTIFLIFLFLPKDIATMAFTILSVVFNLAIIFSFISILYLLIKWIGNATLKRSHFQAIVLTISTFISIFGIIISLFIDQNNYWADITIYIGQLVFIVICNHYAHQYNSLSFNVPNLAGYIYTAVNLPLLIIDETSKIMMNNVYAEKFFQKSTGELGTLTLFDLFVTKEDFSDVYRSKKDNTVENTDAICCVAGQKCQLSLNYVYDKFEELVCAVVIVNDITEKENLIRELNESKVKIQHYNQELQLEVERQTESIRSLQEAVVYSMSDLIEKKDGYTGGYTRRVSGYITILLHELVRRGYPISNEEIQTATKSSLLHDMGKIAIPDSILLKNGKLNDDEFGIMKTHSSVGADSLHKSMEMVKDNNFLEIAYEMAMYHHEKWNGGGYPSGKQGEDIPFFARVIAIADVYDALRSERSYKAAFSREKAKSIIVEGKGQQFDPQLVEAFLAVEPQFHSFCEQNS